MKARRIFAAVAASAIALTAAGSSLAQNGAFNTNEAGLRARDKAALDKVTALVAADKARPRIGGIWRITAPAAAVLTLDGKLPAMTPEAQKLYRQRVADRILVAIHLGGIDAAVPQFQRRFDSRLAFGASHPECAEAKPGHAQAVCCDQVHEYASKWRSWVQGTGHGGEDQAPGCAGPAKG